MILKIDVQGAQVVKEQVADALLVFLVPPSLEELFQRLRTRATETADELEVRQRNAAIELARQDDYDYVVVNETGRSSGRPREIDEIIAQEKRRNPTGAIRVDARRRDRRRLGGSDAGRGGPVADGRPARSRSRSTRRAGPAPRTYTYRVPEALADLEPGEAVLVEFEGGARRSGSCWAERQRAAGRGGAARSSPASAPTGRCCRRSPCALAGVDRGPVPRAAGPGDPGDAAARAARAAGAGRRGDARPARRGSGRPSPDWRPRTLDLLDTWPDAARGRSATLRRPRAGPGSCAACAPWPTTGSWTSTWTLLGAAVGPRYERWAWLTAERARRGGHAGARASGAVRSAPRAAPAGRAHGLLATSSRAGPADGLSAAALASPSATGVGGLAGLVRRGLVRREVRERPRRPLAAPAGRPARRPARRCGPARPTRRPPSRWCAARSRPATPRPLLLDGVTGGGKTAIYVEAIAASLEAGRPALRPRPGDRPGDCRSSTGSGPTSTPGSRSLHSGLGDGERADEWRRIRAGDVDIVVGTRTGRPRAARRRRARSSSTRSTTRPTRATGRRASRPATWRSGSARLAGAAVVLGSATPAVESDGPRARGTLRRVVLPVRAVRRGAAVVEVVDLRAELARRATGACSRWRSPAPSPRSTRLPATRRSSSSTGAGPRRSCCAATAATSRPARTASGRSSTTRPGPRCAATTAAGPRRSPRAARPARSPRIRYLGGGTERVEREVRDAFPGLRVGRLDRDVVERQGAAERVLDAFAGGRLDVLVGTSLVAKGLDVPR